MSDSGEDIGAAGDGAGNTTSSAGAGQTVGMNAVMNHISENKVESAMWLSRISTLFFTVSFVLPIFGWTQPASGQKVLISGAITSALRLHQRMPQFSMSRQFLSTLLLEDSAHYLIYSVVMLYSCQPASMTLMPVTLFALLHVTKYTKVLLNLLGPPTSMTLVRNLITKIETNQQMLLKLIATVEISLMPTIVIMIFFGQATLLLPFVYYRFLCLRYTSIRNPYSRTVFYELRLLGEHMSRDQRCPVFVGNLIHKVIAFTNRLAPTTATSTSPPQQ